MTTLPCPDCEHDISQHLPDEIDSEGDRHGRGCGAVDYIGKAPRMPTTTRLTGVNKERMDAWRAKDRASRRYCACWRSPEAIADPERFAPKLRPGDRVRSIQHPELTGVVKHYEYHERGWLSPIPYCIGWDDSARACAVLGWLFVYATDHGVEALT